MENKNLENWKVPVETYTRVVGFYAKVANFNPGKRQEFEDRVYFKLPEDLK